jgi:hypothetical protein
MPDISVRDYATVEEYTSKLFELVLLSVSDAAAVAENITRNLHFPISVVQAVTVSESVTTPVMALKLSRGTSSMTVTLITQDWAFVTAQKQFAITGVPLKALVLIPGSGAADVFVIKDTSDAGAILYKGTVNAGTVVVYPGSYCKPYIDFSECTFTAGHSVTFIW